jgi:pimeloyl-ACP methyl ester carboxylesterase
VTIARWLGCFHGLSPANSAVIARLQRRSTERLGGFEPPSGCRSSSARRLIAWSADDEFFPLDDARRLAAALPDSRLAVIEGARTLSMLDRPEQLAGLIDDFSSSTPAPHASSAHQSR